MQNMICVGGADKVFALVIKGQSSTQCYKYSPCLLLQASKSSVSWNIVHTDSAKTLTSYFNLKKRSKRQSHFYLKQTMHKEKDTETSLEPWWLLLWVLGISWHLQDPFLKYVLLSTCHTLFLQSSSAFSGVRSISLWFKGRWLIFRCHKSDIRQSSYMKNVSQFSLEDIILTLSESFFHTGAIYLQFIAFI